MNPKRLTPRYIIIKTPKVKDKENLKSSKSYRGSYLQGSSQRLPADFSTETLKIRRDWQEILKMMKRKDLQLRLLYPAMLLFRIEGQIKSFQDKKKVKELITTIPVL